MDTDPVTKWQKAGDREGRPNKEEKGMQKEPSFRMTLFVLALTYFPGSSPSKYRRHW